MYCHRYLTKLFFVSNTFSSCSRLANDIIDQLCRNHVILCHGVFFWRPTWQRSVKNHRPLETSKKPSSSVTRSRRETTKKGNVHSKHLPFHTKSHRKGWLVSLWQWEVFYFKGKQNNFQMFFSAKNDMSTSWRPGISKDTPGGLQIKILERDPRREGSWSPSSYFVRDWAEGMVLRTKKILIPSNLH